MRAECDQAGCSVSLVSRVDLPLFWRATRTKRTEISCKMSMTSRAFSFFDSLVDMFVDSSFDITFRPGPVSKMERRRGAAKGFSKKRAKKW